MEIQFSSNKIHFWAIIIASIVVVILMFAALSAYQIRDNRTKTAAIAVPTMTAESIEFHYQKGLGYINLRRWQEARVELETVFEIDPTYKDIQSKLKEVYGQIEMAEQNSAKGLASVPEVSANTPVPLAMPEDILYTGEERVWAFTAPTESRLLLSLEARIAWDKLAGSANIMEITVNDAPVTGERLINKASVFIYADGRQYEYYDSFREGTGSGWMLFYSPDYESNNMPGSRYQVEGNQAYSYVFDITSLVKYGQENRVKVRNRSEAVQLVENRPIPLAIRRVELLWNAGE